MEPKIIKDPDRFFKSLPGQHPVDLIPRIREQLIARETTIVVLDDDPTGTQTVYGIPVLTDWSEETIRKEFEAKSPLFYILTNSRSLSPEDAEVCTREISRHLARMSKKTGRNFLVISRSDSTLRGHYPLEVNALEAGLDKKGAIKVLIPAFFEGGRYTVQNIHYVNEGKVLIPAAQTPFARDKTFGFQSSDLRQYVEEKSAGEIKSEQVITFSIAELRMKDPAWIAEKINSLPWGATCIVNAASYRDLEVFALGYYLSKREMIFRTAASIVPVLAGLRQKPLLSAEDLRSNAQGGVLLVVGSYVPRTTAQLTALMDVKNLELLEIDVAKLIDDRSKWQKHYRSKINDGLGKGTDMVIFTSRLLISSADPGESLAIGNKVSAFLVELVKGLNTQPKCIIAKGGITSSDIATKGLKVRRALVLGQIAPGVPVWALGQESHFPGMYYIVFPGNVGDDETLKEVFLKVK
jgi:uncharacterized protein YgbK (DUF1537 family)